MNRLWLGVPQEVRKPARDWAWSSLELFAVGESHRHSACGLSLSHTLPGGSGDPGTHFSHSYTMTDTLPSLTSQSLKFSFAQSDRSKVSEGRLG